VRGGGALRSGLRLLLRAAASAARTSAPAEPRRAPRSAAPPTSPPSSRGGHGTYAGDATGAVRPQYAPHADGDPDPGEVVWAWVPYEEDHSRGKDRPVLVIARDGAQLLGLMLTSKDHDRDAEQEARAGRHWVDVGSGAWDRQGRPSEVRVDRVLRLDPSAVRREGAVLDRTRYERVAAEVARVRG